MIVKTTQFNFKGKRRNKYTRVFVHHQIGQLRISLKSVLDKWSQYKQASEEINGYMTEGRYSVSRYRLLTGSLEAAQLQVQSLQVKHVLINDCIRVCRGRNESDSVF